MPAFAEVDADTARAVLEEAGKFASEVLAPINAAADLQGCSWNDGVVSTPAGYKEAYAAYRRKAAGRRCPATPTMAARACRRCWMRR